MMKRKSTSIHKLIIFVQCNNRDVRVQILIWFQTLLLFTEFHFRTFDVLENTTFQVFQVVSDFSDGSFSHTLSHPCNKDEIVKNSVVYI